MTDSFTHISNVAVWNYDTQEFVPHVDCPNEKRVRIDASDDLSNYAVFAVERNGNVVTVIDDKPLADYMISRS